MFSPLDDPDIDFVVIVNDEGQHCMWPVSVAVPEGWTVSYGPAARDDCLGYVRASWTDMRPASARTARCGDRDQGR
jgi:MbtH protein